MLVIDLPIPAFECIVEHMVTTVGLYKGVRLRLVCKTFDAEVRRAIFATNSFSIDHGFHAGGPTREYLPMWLVAKILRPIPNDHDNLRSLFTTATKHLLENKMADDLEQRRLAYTRILCGSIAHNYEDHFFVLLVKISEEDGGSSFAGNEVLSAAAAVGDLEMGFNISTRAALWTACGAGQRDVFEYLLSPRFQKYFSTEDFDYSFKRAAENGHISLLELLLHRITTVLYNNVLNQSLSLAASHGRPLAVQCLLNSGADINSYDYSGAALQSAARSGFTQVVRLLLDQSVVYRSAKRRFRNSFILAAINGNTEVVQILLDAGPDINAGGRRNTAFARAARNGETTTVKFLLDNGIDLEARYNGHRALEGAVQQGHEDIVRLLVSLGVNVNREGGDREPPILRAMLQGQQRVFDTLVELGAEKIDPLRSRWAYKFKDMERES
ncbi:MAG: hypothetical protein Q9170_005598 [Blastenia crenularia]